MIRRSRDIYTRSIQQALVDARTWEHVFRARDIFERVLREVGFNPPPPLPKKSQRTRSYERGLAESKRVRRAVAQEIQDALRKSKDGDAFRIFVCQPIVGQREGNWIRLNCCTKEMLVNINGSRRKLAAAVRPLYLQLALPLMEAAGPEATFGDVREEVLRRWHSSQAA